MQAVVLVIVLFSAVYIQQSETVKTIPDATLRLIGGATRCSGQVQIKYEDIWFSVCRTDWGELEGQVVCRQLGCGDLVSPYANYKDKAPSHPVWSEMVSCTGDEMMLRNCSGQGNGSNTNTHCPDTYRAAVACRQEAASDAAEPMTVRLVNGTTTYSGRVEIYYNGEWGTICGQNSWSLTDGQVVCRQLHYTDAVAVRDHYNPFGAGNGTILLSFVDCDGSEDLLGACQHQGWYKHNCDHFSDAGVICKVSASDDSMVRLMDGTSQYNGRVEVHYNGEWGTVCDDGWDINDAQVICRQLGFGPAISIGGPYGKGKGAILLSDVACEGTERSISHCANLIWYQLTYCHHKEDAGVICGVPEDPSVRVRLADGVLESSGRVEVYHNGEWGAACGKTFRMSEADVVCRQLGFRKALKVKESGYYGDAELIILSGASCEGSEKHLEDCQLIEWYPAHSVCSSQETAGIECDVDSQPITVSSVNVRLTGSPSDREGQVEVYHDGMWGTICVTGFDMHAANVVCKQLGFYGAKFIPWDGRFSDGKAPVLLDSLPCRTGMEKNVANCVPLEWYRHDWHNCKPDETAAVVCFGSLIDSELEIVIRLSNGTQDSNGRLEVYHHSKWGSVCGAGLSQNEAEVACHQLGYKQGNIVKEFGFYGSGTGDISMWAFSCTGMEVLVQECFNIEWYDTNKHVCDEKQTAGVVCSQGDSGSEPSMSSKARYQIMLVIILAVMIVVMSAVGAYCTFLRRSRRNAADTQMRYAVLDRQDNSSAY